MKIGIQEIVALGIVLAVVAFAIWRRWKKGRSGQGTCDGCDKPSVADSAEKTIHPYRRTP